MDNTIGWRIDRLKRRTASRGESPLRDDIQKRVERLAMALSDLDGTWRILTEDGDITSKLYAQEGLKRREAEVVQQLGSLARKVRQLREDDVVRVAFNTLTDGLNPRLRIS